MLRSGPVGWLTLAISAGGLASCSADVSGYHLDTDTAGATGGRARAVGGSTSSGGGTSIGGIGGRGTGGAVTGGAGAGGAGTGGTATGGAGMGGAGAGGTVGWPGGPVQIQLSPTVSRVTAAAWQLSTHRFFLLIPSANQYVTVDTTGAVSAPVNLPTGTIAPNAFGVSGMDVFFVVGTTLYRKPIGVGAPVIATLPGAPISKGLSGAYAEGWFLVGNASGASAALQDGSGILDPNAPNLTQLYVVTTDGAGFAFRALGANYSLLHRIAPGSFALNGSPCNTGSFSTSNGEPVGVYGNSVAWVVRPGSSNPYTLNVAPTNAGVCGKALTASFGAGNGSQAVGLIDATHALVTPSVVSGNATIDIKQAGGTLTLTPLENVSMGTGSPTMFVVGVDTVTHYAVLVTNDIPVLVSF